MLNLPSIGIGTRCSRPNLITGKDYIHLSRNEYIHLPPIFKRKQGRTWCCNNNFDCQRNTRNRSASRRIILSISKTRVFIFAEKYSIFYSPRMSKKKWIHWNQRCVEISTCIHIRFLAILKREKEWTTTITTNTSFWLARKFLSILNTR